MLTFPSLPFLTFFLQNPRKRPTMEDSHMIIRSLHGEELLSYIGVYDGHGGRGIVDYLESNLDRIIYEELTSTADQDDASIPERLARFAQRKKHSLSALNTAPPLFLPTIDILLVPTLFGRAFLITDLKTRQENLSLLFLSFFLLSTLLSRLSASFLVTYTAASGATAVVCLIRAEPNGTRTFCLSPFALFM